MSNPRQITVDKLVCVGFWTRVTFYNIYHGWFVAIAFAIFVSESKVIVLIVKLFEAVYAAPATEGPNGKQKTRTEKPSRTQHPILPFRVPLPPKIDQMKPREDAATLPAASQGAPNAPANYLPVLITPKAGVGPNPLTPGAVPQSPNDRFKEELQKIDLSSAIATAILRRGKPAFMYAIGDWEDAGRFEELNAQSSSIDTKFNQPNGVFGCEKLEFLPPGFSASFSLGDSPFDAIRFNVSYGLFDKVNNLVQIFQNPPVKQENPNGSLGAFFAGMGKKVADHLVGSKGATDTLLSALNALTDNNPKTAFGFFPKGMPADGSDSTTWEKEIKKQFLEMKQNGALEPMSKSSDGACVYTRNLSDEEVQVLLSMAAIAHGPSSFDGMILERRLNGVWRLGSFASTGTTQAEREASARERLEQVLDKLAELAKS
ncbi:MAG: hypothetical protein LBB26_00850 [Puniceicoccales bacterium]|nr:hypothetical protein [Puniceicoccales bacterium]